ncbi:MAG: AbrB/MazE/SpoVT family DNA-binding domain-containing protein [Nitrospirota bacterium]
MTKKGQVTIPKQFRESLNIQEGDDLVFEMRDDMLILKKKERRSILSLGGIARGRRVGTGNEIEYAKKIVSKKISQEGLKNG